MTRLVLLLVAAAALTGCARTRTITQTETVEVRVPVAVPCPAPPIPARPPLAIAELSESSADGEVVRAYLATVVALIGYSQELERLLDAYRPARSGPASLGQDRPISPTPQIP